MAEFIIIMPVMLVLLFAVDYFRTAYLTRMAALAASQREAWSLVTRNDIACFNGQEGWDDLTRGHGDTDVFGGQAGGMFPGAAQAWDSSETESSIFRYGHVNMSKSAPVKAFSYRKNAPQRTTLPANVFIMCNEVVPGPNDDTNILEPVWSFVKSIFNGL